MEIGLSTGVFYSKPIGEVLPLVSRAGFTAVELWTGDPFRRTPFDWRDSKEVAAVRKLLQDLGLRAVSFHAPYAEEADPSEPDPRRRQKTTGLLTEAVQVAAALGTPTLILHGSAAEVALLPEAERAARNEALRESLSLLHREARARGVALAIETLLPHLFTADASLLLDLVQPYPRHEVGLCFDTGHCFLWHSWRLDRLYDALSERVIALHVNDNRGTADDHLPPGRGRIDWLPWLDALRRSAFSGVFLLEVVLPQDAPDAAAAIAALRKEGLALLGAGPVKTKA